MVSFIFLSFRGMSRAVVSTRKAEEWLTFLLAYLNRKDLEGGLTSFHEAHFTEVPGISLALRRRWGCAKSHKNMIKVFHALHRTKRTQGIPGHSTYGIGR